MLQVGVFAEGIALGSGKVAEIELPDDEPSSMIRLMKLIHGFKNQCRAPSRRFLSDQKCPDFDQNKQETHKDRDSLKMLVEMAVLVDKYVLKETTRYFANLWQGVMLRWDRRIPRTMVPQLFVARMFGLHMLWHWTCSVLERTSEQVFEELLALYEGVLNFPDLFLGKCSMLGLTVDRLLTPD
jgi:hypothetical protein